ncbi:diacylglycerol/lipid kinase family protein [Horticoccus sp. 23ND18S-11]|uniref:diacylglycerol/lipid kinase family protein n=1 Tax=Horticoccus sp. 23ND18S-11 TaxID=3391832 RepID=UPI0039C9C810
MKTCFIFNPNSGRNRQRPRLAGVIREFIASRSLDAHLATTEGPGHATELARAAVRSGHDLVVAVGGDGTMNEVAQGLIHTPVALALVPCGSGNGLALHLGLPRSPLGALQLATGTDRRIVAVDTGTANGLPFVNAMGLGFDADVSQRFNGLTRRGLPAYIRVACAALRNLRSEHCIVSAGTRRETLEVLLIAVANSDQYGNNARIAPGARIDDGRLDLVAVHSVGLWRAGTLVPRLFLGTIDRSPHVTRLTGPRFVIDRVAPGLIHTDGETHPTGARIEVNVQPGSLNVLVPAASGVVAPARKATPARFALLFP